MPPRHQGADRRLTPVSIIMPCYNAQAHITRAVRSVLAQTHTNWELVVVSNDRQDYQKILHDAGIRDTRIKYSSTDEIGTGPSRPRNVGFAHASYDVVALLDSDDAFMPQKLELCAPALKDFGIVSCAFEIRGPNDKALRNIGDSHNGILNAADYKSVNITGDTMLVFDRSRIDVRYDENMDVLEDLDLIMRCFEQTEHVFHIATPPHAYYKTANSISNSGDTYERYKTVKQSLLKRVKNGAYKFKDGSNAAWIKFLETSLRAEDAYAQKVKGNPRILFEDVFEEMLKV